MIQKTALLIASLVASLVLAVGLVVSGVMPASPQAAPVAAETVAATTDAPPPPTVQVDTVYLTPKAKPQVITVKKTAPAVAGGEDGESENDD